MFQTGLRKGEDIFDNVKKMVRIKPQLRYLEFHLTDHCNLNCKGCGHFTPLAGKTFADLNDYIRDLKQLQKLFSTIKTIVLMGGEPLLHPQIEAFLFETRSIFPNSSIKIYTNGILLPKMSESFWNACRACSIDIDITLYPPVKPKEADLIRLVEEKGLKVSTHSITLFFAFYNNKGDTCAKTAYAKCHKRWYNPMLRNGKIYVCHKPATLKYFNKKFNLKIPIDGFVNIHDPLLNGWDVIEKLDIAPSACRYCTLGLDTIPAFPWAPSNRVLQDWDASEAKFQQKI